MKTWADIKSFIEQHRMQYHVIQWNMSNRGCLVGNISDQAIAYTVKDAAKMLRQEINYAVRNEAERRESLIAKKLASLYAQVAEAEREQNEIHAALEGI